jgi:hypothetical protein
VQPQFVFDSMNAGVLLPPALYAPGATLPPHLSPFVGDEVDGGYRPWFKDIIDRIKAGDPTVMADSAIAAYLQAKPKVRARKEKLLSDRKDRDTGGEAVAKLSTVMNSGVKTGETPVVEENKKPRPVVVADEEEEEDNDDDGEGGREDDDPDSIDRSEKELKLMMMSRKKMKQYSKFGSVPSPPSATCLLRTSILGIRKSARSKSGESWNKNKRSGNAILSAQTYIGLHN